MLVYHRNDKSAPKGLRYCGRGGKWGNPFRLPRGADGAARRRVIADYIVYVDEKLATGALDIADLRGAPGLSCWCAPKGAPLSASAEPDRCHAQYLAYLVEREDENWN